MAEFETVLGAGETLSDGFSSSPDAAGRSGSLVMKTNQANGRTAFQLFVDNAQLGDPTAAVIRHFQVFAYELGGCAGPIGPCGASQGWEEDEIKFETPKKTKGDDFEFAPKTHDNGELVRLRSDCNCDTPGVKSFKIIIEVEIVPGPTPPANLVFETCIDCDVAT
ncbi:MAG: hypothetical protein OEM59_15870 [Rhodospirillales bacterium]|nr:hypothetical protein [Rhodospirillales bacterium]